MTYAYKHLLGRDPDPEGLKAMNRCESTEDAGAVIDSLIDSFEYQQSFSDDTVPGSRLRFCGPVRARQAGYGSRTWTPTGTAPSNAANGTAPRRRSTCTTGTPTACCRVKRCGLEAGGRHASRRRTTSIRQGPLRGRRATSACWTAIATTGSASNEWYYSPEYFRRADRDRNGILTATEFTGAAWDDDRDDRFENLDVNNNGRVEAGEWHGSRDAFEWLDRNRDNFLSRAEVVGETGTATPSGTAATSPYTFDTFQSLDLNRNGMLDSAEWQWSLRSFERYDTNRDGRLTRQEFTAGGGAPSAAR